jgi:hypothetical protein
MTFQKVTVEELEAAIAEEGYTVLPGTTTTVCVLKLKNGFIQLGTSACMNPEDYDKEMGEKIARQHAINQLWPLFGFARMAGTLPEPSITAPVPADVDAQPSNMPEMEALGEYESHKTVHAAPIRTIGQPANGQTPVGITLQNGQPWTILCPDVMFARFKPSQGDWLVVYDGGEYASFSPGAKFENGYRQKIQEVERGSAAAPKN